MKKSHKLSAFTLAEMLITLMILGVISALTLPALKNHAEEQKFVALTKKSYSDLVAVISRLEAKYGESQFWQYQSTPVENECIKEFQVNPVDGELKWTSFYLNGESAGDDVYQWVTPDGIAWRYFTEKYLTFKVDVNGSSPPNVVGIDQHIFEVKDESVVPSNGCTYFIIQNAKIPWLTEHVDNCPQV